MRFHFHRSHVSVQILALGLLVVSLFLLQRGLSTAAPTLVGTYPGADEEEGIGLQDARALPGDTNVKIAEYDISVTSQTILYDGANSVSEGDLLTLMSSDTDLYWVDSSLSGNTYDPSEDVVFRSVDDSFTADDTVLISVPYEQFPESPTITNQWSATAWLDQDSDSLFDDGEDFVRIALNPGNISDGDTIRLFADDEVLVTNGVGPLGGGGGVKAPFLSPSYLSLAGTGESVVPAFINDADGDGVLTAGDSVTSAGGAGTIHGLDSADNVCFDGSINDDSEFDYTDADNYEVIWWDAGGDCSSFDTGVDVVLTGKSAGVDVAPTGTSTEFGTEQEVGWNNPYISGGDYSCARGDECQIIFYSGVDGTDWGSGDNFTTNMIFFDGSTYATDGLVDATNEWTSGGWTHLNTLVDLSEEEFNTEPLYFYVDANANTSYDTGETILANAWSEPSSGTTIATGQTIRFFVDYDYYYVLNMPFWGPTRNFLPDRHPLFRSTNDANIDTGLMNDAGWADEFVFLGSQGGGDEQNSFADDSRALTFYDSDLNGDYDEGDDILIGDGTYLVDDLTVLQVEGNHETTIEDVFDAIYITLPAGEECAGVGTDTVIGTLGSAPFFTTDITITADPLAASDNDTAANTICLYADIASDAGLGTKLALQITSATFTSGTVDPDNIADSQQVVLQGDVDLVVTVDPGYIDQQNDIVWTYDIDYDFASADFAIYFGYPTTLGIDDGTFACTINGESVAVMAGGPFTFGPYDVYQAQASQQILAGDQIVCTHADVTGPDTVGAYSGGLSMIDVSSVRALSEEDEISFTFSEEPDDDGGGDGRTIPIITPPDYEVTVLTPNGGEKIKGGTTYPITWSSDEEVKYVNLAFSLDGGKTYSDLVRGIQNTGSFSWKVPEKTSTDAALIRIQSLDTDATSVRNSDVSDKTFSIIDVDLPYLSWRSPVQDSRLQAGGSQWILWESSPLITEVELGLSLDGGETFEISTDRMANKNAYKAILPNIDGDSQEIFMRVVGYSEEFDPIEVIVGPMLLVDDIDNSSITVTNPNAMQAYRPGDVLDITWDTEGEIPFVEIQFAPDGVTWTPITSFIDNKGAYSWKIPDIESQYAFVRVGGNSSYGNFVGDRSDEPFWIIRPFKPSVDIKSPVKGDKFSAGDVVAIIWDSTNDVSSVNLYYQLADGARKAIAIGAKNINLFNWTIPEIPVNSFNLFLEGVDIDGSIIAEDLEGPLGLSLAGCEKPNEFVNGECVEVRPEPPIEECNAPGYRLVGGRCVQIECASGTIFNGIGCIPIDPEDPICPEGLIYREGQCVSPDDGSPGTTLEPAVDDDGGDSGTPGDIPGEVDIAIFDQSGLDIYKSSVTPRVSVANGTISLNPRNSITALIGTNILVELITDEDSGFRYAINDGRTGVFIPDEAGVMYAYIPIGGDTEHIKVKSTDLSPTYELSLRINPELRGSVSGFTERDGTEAAVLLQASAAWDSSESGQVNPARLAEDDSFAWYAPNGRYSVQIQNEEGVIEERTILVRDNIVNPFIELGTPQETVSPIVDFLLPADAEEVLIELREDPVAKSVASVATPTSAAAVVASTLVLGSFFNLFNFLQSLLSAPFLLLGRRKRKSYGVVYNSATGAPVPFATIRFYDGRNTMARTIVTNTRGEYSVSLPPGKYRPVVVKKGYTFPSESALSIDDDVYVGGFVEVSPEIPFVTMRFPIDPDQVANKVTHLGRLVLLRRVQQVVSFVGILLSLYAMLIQPSWWNFTFLTLQVLVVVAASLLSRVHIGERTGVVLDKTGKPVSGAIVRLFESKYDKLIETQRTDSKGRYNFMAKQGEFYVAVTLSSGEEMTSRVVDLDESTELKPVAPKIRFS